MVRTRFLVLWLMLLWFFGGMIPEDGYGQRVKAGRSDRSKAADTIRSIQTDAQLMKEHSPHKATIYSALVPGLGQIYNKKWWKVPIIYAGFGVMTYFIYTNADEYLDYRCAQIEKDNGITNGNYAYLVNKYTADELNSASEYYRRNLEVSILITSVWYILNIIDATVDAHLYSYTITDDLSLKVGPGIGNQFPTTPQPGMVLPPVNQGWAPQPGIRISFHF